MEKVLNFAVKIFTNAVITSWKVLCVIFIHSILYLGPKIWDSLPVSITCLSSFPSSKKEMLEFLLK